MAMKYLIAVFLVFFAVSARAQITLEHDYPLIYSQDFDLIQVDSDEWKYIYTDFYPAYDDTTRQDSIYIYNLDHSLDRIVITPVRGNTPLIIAKNLFDLEGDFAYMFRTLNANGLEAFKEDGTLLFSCDTCTFKGIRSTERGSKMIIQHSNLNIWDLGVEVYSLPGKLPGASTTLGVTNPSIISGNPSLPISVYPNPSNGRVRITYELPSGVSTGQIILLTEDGREAKRYHVTNAFNDLLIEESDLPSGSYFYKLVTDKGESQAKRIVLLK